MTVLIGPNNTGKSYTATPYYALMTMNKAVNINETSKDKLYRESTKTNPP
ncbi:hypothetical protein [Vulcanisaeta thermophila]|nr:hypothetical protein [Vulcanisaeta thermophila]